MSNLNNNHGTFTADGTADVQIPIMPGRSTPLTLFGEGTFGSGALKVQVSGDGDIAHATDLTGITLSADGYKTLPLIQGVFHVVLSGSTNPNLKWFLQ